MTLKILPEIPLILLRQLRQEVNRFICLCELLCESPHLLLELLDLPRLRVVVPNRLIRNITCLTRVLHRADVFVYVRIAGVQARDHETETIASQGLSEEASQL